MPYPQDPFALKVNTPFICPECDHRPMIRETRDQNSPFLGQVRCESCGYTSEFQPLQKSLVLKKQEDRMVRLGKEQRKKPSKIK